MKKAKPSLSWMAKDFLEFGYDIPEEILENPGMTEGETMGENDIKDWILDTKKTFLLLGEENEKLFEELYNVFVRDIKYLAKLGKINSDYIDDIINKDNFKL